MADNTVLNTGTGGDTIATDDIGGIKHQRVKLSVGADGTANDAVPVSNGMDVTGAAVQAVGIVGQYDDVSVGTVTENQFAPVRISSRRALLVEGVASGTAIPVSLASIPTHDVTNVGTFATQVTGSALTALQLIDNIVLAEDAAHSSGDPGVMAMAVRRDANTSLVDTTGDYAPLQVDATGSLKVAIISGAGSGGTSSTDDAAFSVASGSGTPIMGLADETGPDSVDEGDVGVVRMTLARALHVTMRDAAGDSCMDESNNAVKVSIVSGGLTPTKAATATLANVSGNASSVTLQASNTSRLGLTINNDSEAILYVKYGSSASTTSFTYKLGPFESLREELYTGIVTGIWDSAVGAARMTELTA